MKNYLLIFSILIILGSCSTREENKENNQALKNKNSLNYEPTVLPRDTTSLWMGEGDINSETVLLIAESGPKAQLTFDWRAKEVWSRLPNYFDYYRVHIHQATTLNNAIYDWKDSFTQEMAELEVNNGTEILARAVTYFKERNKKVIVVGTFWSAFVIQDYIAKYGNNADRYLISGGRLDLNPEQYKYHLKGFQAVFKEDGKTTVVPDTTIVIDPRKEERRFRISKVTQLMKGVMKRQRFTQELAERDLSNVVYGYAINDIYLGALTDKELAFLESKGATVYSTDQGHFGVDGLLLELVMDGTIKL